MVIMKKAIIAGIGVAAFILLAYQAGITHYNFNSHSSAELTFAKSRWDPALVTQLEAGPHYLSPHLAINIPPPPSPSEVTEELAYLKTLEEQRTPAQKEMINSQVEDFKAYFLEQAGIDPVTKPLTILLMKEAVNEVGFYILREKWRIQRARPYDLDPTLTPSVPPPRHSSYPSGHGGQSWAVALLLSEIDPTHKNLWLDTARSIGHYREIAGVHFPTDTKAGQLVAEQVMPLLLENAKFKVKFDQVRQKEWVTQKTP
jgi:hypothetical protein